MKTRKYGNKLRKNPLKLNWAAKTLYREVTLFPGDFKKLVRVLERLKKFYSEAQIVHTRDIEELENITKNLETILKKYDKAFENHSV